MLKLGFLQVGSRELVLSEIVIMQMSHSIDYI